ncbi:MAG: hypothetical protein C0445_08820 [Polaromonas sp.]|nr:hypothetical protein [Polaromonas sp.]
MKAVLAESAKQWLLTLHAVWKCSSLQTKTATQTFTDQVATWLPANLAFHELDAALHEHCHQAFLQMLWEHEQTKALVRSGASHKKAFLQSNALQEANAFDVQAVLRTLTLAASNPETQAARRQTIAAALRSLGHFTSKPTHTSAQALGIVIDPKARSIGPYLTAGMLQEHERPLMLDQAVNDNTGKTSFCLDVLNGNSTQADAATSALVRQVATELFANGYEHGTHTIDPRLRQILLPATDVGRYRAITPLTSMGLSAYLHSHWQSRQPGEQGASQSFGKLVFHGFSTTAMNNFTAIRRVQHAAEPDKTVGSLPNRAWLFEVPRLDEAHAVLTRIRHRGYHLHLPKPLQERLFAGYVRHYAILHVDTVRAVHTEQQMYRPLLRFMWADLLHQRSQCIDALEELDEAARTAILADAASQTTAEQFLLAGIAGESEQGVPLRRLSTRMASLLFRQVEQLKDGNGKTLGLSVIDRQRFMRWAPQAIAHTFSQH